MDETLLRAPGAGLRYLVEADALVVCPPITASRFVDHCRDRGIDVDLQRLEKLEQLGVIFPLARVEYPVIQMKVDRDAAGLPRDLGMLNEGEAWKGELREEYSRFSFRRDWASTWLESGWLWDPRERPFASWDSFWEEGQRLPKIESFYSIFQAYSLRYFLTSSTTRVLVEFAVQWKDDPPLAAAERIGKLAAMVVDNARKKLRGDDAVFLAQAVSNRYFFQTQSDRRTIRVSSDPFDEWSWDECVRGWNAQNVAVRLKLDAAEVAAIQQDVSMLVQGADPLARWYDLLSFVSVDKRQELKGDAQFAQFGYSMDAMLRFFYRDLTGKSLRPPSERHAGLHQNDSASEEPTLLEQLEYIVNAYYLNPRPRLILVVEGDGEEEALPVLARDLLGLDLGGVGIEVRNLHGIGEFTGSRHRDRYGALEKFIEDHHYRQTIVFCILDNEGQAAKTRERLLKARSQLVPSRLLTCPEYLRLWNDCIEFDNFSDSEIATAMIRIGDGRHLFAESEIAQLRVNGPRGRRGDPLAQLYATELKYDLDKKALLRELTSLILADPERELADPPPRPIVQILRRVVDLAAMNHQPVSGDIWQRNQDTGYFGPPIPPTQ
jgi:hypothetical protein